MTRRALLVSFSVAHFAHHVTNSLLSALLPFIQSAFGLSYTGAGFLVSAYSIASGVTNAPLGVLADRIGARRVIVWGLVLIGLSSVAIGLSTEYWQLLAFLAVMGIASGTYHAPASALIAELFSSRRGMAMGTHTTAGHLSFFAAPLLAGILATAGTWRTPYLAFALAPILCAVLIWRVAPMGIRSTGRHSWLATGSDIAAVARRVGALVSLSIVFQVVLSAALAFLSTYLVDARGISPGVAAALFGVPQLAGLVGAPMAGTLSDRFGRRIVLLLGLALMGPAAWALTVVPSELVFLPLLLIGISFSIRATTTEVLIVDNTPPERRSTVLGTYYLVNQPVGGVAAPIFGGIAGAIGIGAAYGWLAAVFLVLSGIALIAAARTKDAGTRYLSPA
ncbi:MAG TPA: MFS transporter [Candidatus Limnocylindria bacterium]|nr:MFS transporter [Candidatus Limnocylindria bacterium]